MTKKRLTALFLCVFLLTGCAQTATPHADTAAVPSFDDVPSDISVPPIPAFTQAREVRILLPETASSQDKAHLARANELLRNAGFAVTLEAPEVSGNTTSDAFLDGVRASLSDNTVCIVFASQAAQLTSEGVLGDFYAQGAMIAPQLVGMFASLANEEGTLTAIPLSILTPDLFRPAVLIRNDVYAQYGQDVRTGSQYRALLEYLKDAAPDKIPGALSPRILSAFYNDILAISALLPEYGYAPYSSGLYGTADSMYAVYALDAAHTALLELADWKQEGLVDFYEWDNSAIGQLGNYPTLLLNTDAFLSDRTLMQFPAFDQTQFSDYHLCVLYGDRFPSSPNEDVPYATRFAVAGPDADLTELFRLLEWLQTPENYRLFTYGEEGRDYTIENGGIAYVGQNSYGRAFFHFYFKQSQLELLPRSNVPANLAEEIEAIRAPYTLLEGIDTAHLEQAYLAAQDDISAGISTFYTSTSSLIDALYTQDADAFSSTLDTWFEMQRAKDPLGPFTALYTALPSANQ